MAVTQAQLAADIATLSNSLLTLQQSSLVQSQDIQAEVDALKAQVAAGQPPDFTALDAAVQSSINVAAQIQTQVASNDPGALAAKLAFLVQPSSGAAGAAIAPSIQVAVQDTNGNTIAAATNTVTLIVTSPAGALVGSTSQSAVGGVATFAGLSITPAGSYSLAASASGMSATANSSSFALA